MGNRRRKGKQPPQARSKTVGQQATHLKPSAPSAQGNPPAQVRVIVSHRGRKSTGSTPESSPEKQLWDFALGQGNDRPSIRVLVASKDPHLSSDLEEGADQEDRAPIRILAYSRAALNRQRWVGAIATLLLISMAVLTGGGGWLAIQFILNPGSLGWMRGLFPAWSHYFPIDAGIPTSLADLHRRADAAGVFLGEPLPLGTTGDWVIPVSAQSPPCSGAIEAIAPAAGCGAITELRVYRPLTNAPHHKAGLQLVDRLAMPGLTVAFIVAPLGHTSTSEGSSQWQPITTISPLPGQPPEAGIWFQVSGEWVRSNQRILYGQVMGYDPERARLATRLQWSSPVGELPVWKQITGTETPELVVNQTLGLEPNFQVYQVNGATANGTANRLEAIALAKATLNNPAYKNALLLARNKLWSTAWQTLQQVKQQIQKKPSGWSSMAQAQMDLIRIHAEFTNAQAQRAWASPSEQITALLINGQWADALHRLRLALKDGYDLSLLLKDESGGFWQRVEAALQINRRQLDVQSWGAIILTVQQGRRTALTWLQAQQPQPNPPLTQPIPMDSRLQELVNLLSTLPTEQTPMPHSTRLLGTVTPLTTLQPSEWIQTQTNGRLQLEERQVWYQVQVLRFHDGQRWWRSPFTNLNLPAFGIANELWDLLGLNQTPSLQLIVWSADGHPHTRTAMVKAIQFRQGVLTLLAAGEPLPVVDSVNATPPDHPLAMTADALVWMEPVQTLSLDAVRQRYPTWATVLLPAIWQELQSGETLVRTSPELETIAADLGSLSIELLDLTGNDQPEAILTIQPTPTSTEGSGDRPRKLIFSDQGKLIYGSLREELAEDVVAIATVAGNERPVLLVNRSHTYLLKQWSLASQQFEASF